MPTSIGDILRQTLSQSDEPSDLLGSLSPTKDKGVNEISIDDFVIFSSTRDGSCRVS